jgi:predicted lactoylglutathione lyase
MSDRSQPLVPRFTVITLGVDDIKASIAFYEGLGFSRRMGAPAKRLRFRHWRHHDCAICLGESRARGRRCRATWASGVSRRDARVDCQDRAEVDAVLAFALGHGAKLLKAAAPTGYGGYAGYFADPDRHVWEAVVAPGIAVGADRRVHLSD